jgi:hypothetical protein
MHWRLRGKRDEDGQEEAELHEILTVQ